MGEIETTKGPVYLMLENVVRGRLKRLPNIAITPVLSDGGVGVMYRPPASDPVRVQNILAMSSLLVSREEGQEVLGWLYDKNVKCIRISQVGSGLIPETVDCLVHALKGVCDEVSLKRLAEDCAMSVGQVKGLIDESQERLSRSSTLVCEGDVRSVTFVPLAGVPRSI